MSINDFNFTDEGEKQENNLDPSVGKLPSTLENVDEIGDKVKPTFEQTMLDTMKSSMQGVDIERSDLDSKESLNRCVLEAYDKLLRGDSLISRVYSKIQTVMLVEKAKNGQAAALKVIFEGLSSPESVLSDVLPEGIRDEERIRTALNGRGVTPTEIATLQELNCAGRSALLAKLLDALDVAYFVTSPRKHSLVVAKLDSGYVYMDPQQGVLVQNIPEESIHLTTHDESGAKFLECSVAQFPRADYQGLGFIYDKMEVSSVGEQFLSNFRQPIDSTKEENHPLFEWLDSVDKSLKGMAPDANLDAYNKAVDDVLAVSFSESVGKLKLLFETLAKNDWQVNKDLLSGFEGLYPGCHSVEVAQSLVDRWMGYESSGKGDELFDNLAMLFGFVNYEGVTIREILIAGRMRNF